jgi:hypothetical protein
LKVSTNRIAEWCLAAIIITAAAAIGNYFQFIWGGALDLGLLFVIVAKTRNKLSGASRPKMIRYVAGICLTAWFALVALYAFPLIGIFGTCCSALLAVISGGGMIHGEFAAD